MCFSFEISIGTFVFLDNIYILIEKRFKKTTKATCDNFNDILYNSIGRCSIMV